MSFEMFIIILVVLIIAGVIAIFVSRIVKRRRRSASFQKKWKEIQTLCADQNNWSMAMMRADDLVGKALKRKNYKGKNVGERMVAAQKIFSNNQALWNAHKLSSRVKDHPEMKLKKSEVKNSLLSFGRALKELGVL